MLAIIFTATSCALQASSICAQSQTDSLKRGINRYTDRNFSELRTINLHWEIMPSYNYALEQNNEDFEEGKMETLRNVKFQTTIPVFRSDRFSLYVNGNIDYYHFKVKLDDGKPSTLFMEKENDRLYMKGGVAFNYYATLLEKPLLLNLSVGIDGWEKGVEQFQGGIMANLLLKQTQKNNVSVGLYVMYPYQITPVVPIVIWTHRLSPNWILDFTLPSRMYVRYQRGKHRFSAGTQMETEQFYMQAPTKYMDVSQQEGESTYYYNKSMFKAELVYECILNERFYFIARGGGAGTIAGGLYDTDRKGIDNKPFVEISHSVVPFFNVGFSYSIFK